LSGSAAAGGNGVEGGAEFVVGLDVGVIGTELLIMLVDHTK
jgi:hypothetical protein